MSEYGISQDNARQSAFYAENDRTVDAGPDYALSDCMNWDTNPNGDCGGAVEERLSRSGLTVSVKCENCYNALQERLDEIEQRYPDSPIAPAWFDPTYAGETWDDDY